MHEDPVPPAPDLSIIVPCYNEEGSLQELVERLGAAFDVYRTNAEVVLVDDCSRDGTRAVIQELVSARPGQVRGVFHGAAAFRAGVQRRFKPGRR